jgi:type VI secretion system protein VasD
LIHTQGHVQIRENDALATPTSNRRRRILTALLVAPLAFTWGCAKKPEVKEKAPEVKPDVKEEKPPPKLRIQIKAASDANLGPGGKGLPVVVRLYELKSPGSFATADFFRLYDHESEVLGADLIARHEVTLAPGQSLPIERPLNAEAGYLGVIAAFRDIDHSHWRESLRLNPEVDNQVAVAVGAKAVAIRLD